MMRAVFFWILILLWVVLGGCYSQGKCPWWGPGIILLFLLILLGLQVFGSPL